ncbi:DUF559 domain-containing protein [Pseudonocardia sp. NPDC046786]|uniref:endonuclease domain-containing protein n=1 Tax=Pseudonocardia sp. NPDC046786 TaxID=3155471 RepID=UPI0033EF8365
MDPARVLREQDGVLTAAQAEACGIPPRAARRRIAAGRWSAPFPGVFHDRGHRYGPRARIRSAGLWSGGVVSGPAAAWWWGMLDVVPAVVDVTVPRGRRRRARPGVRVRRRDLDPADRVLRHGLGITGRPLTVLEAAVVLDDGSAMVDRALQRWVTFDALHGAWCRMAGATGARRARELLVAAADRAGSDAERRLVRLLRSAGIDGWVLGHRVGPYELDLAFPAARLGVEFDGWAWHSDVVRFRNDRRKGNELAGAGWTVLRVTWHDLDTAPGRIVAQIRHALRLAG